MSLPSVVLEVVRNTFSFYFYIKNNNNETSFKKIAFFFIKMFIACWNTCQWVCEEPFLPGLKLHMFLMPLFWIKYCIVKYVLKQINELGRCYSGVQKLQIITWTSSVLICCFSCHTLYRFCCCCFPIPFGLPYKYRKFDLSLWSPISVYAPVNHITQLPVVFAYLCHKLQVLYFSYPPEAKWTKGKFGLFQ